MLWFMVSRMGGWHAWVFLVVCYVSQSFVDSELRTIPSHLRHLEGPYSAWRRLAWCVWKRNGFREATHPFAAQLQPLWLYRNPISRLYHRVCCTGRSLLSANVVDALRRAMRALAAWPVFASHRSRNHCPKGPALPSAFQRTARLSSQWLQ